MDNKKVYSPVSGAGAYLIEDYLGRKAARSPPPGGHLKLRPVLTLYLKSKISNYKLEKIYIFYIKLVK